MQKKLQRVPVTRKLLVDWGGDKVLRDAEGMVAKGMVLEAEYEPPYIRGAILYNRRPLQTRLRILSETVIESECPCRANKELGLICPHVIALGLVLLQRQTDPRRNEKLGEEMRRAARIATVAAEKYLKRVPPQTPGALPADLRLTLGNEWSKLAAEDAIPLQIEIGRAGSFAPINTVKQDLPYSFAKKDETILYVLEDIAGGPIPGDLTISRSDFVNLLPLLRGQELAVADGSQVVIGESPMHLVVKMDLDRETGELILIGHTELPFVKPGQIPVYVVTGSAGWVFGGGHLWPLADILPGPYFPLYEEPVVIRRADVLRFIQKELPALSRFVKIESELSSDLFTIEPEIPVLRLTVRGSPASLSAECHAVYGELELVADKPDGRDNFGIPDPEDLLRYTVRDRGYERHALERLSDAGFRGETGDDLSSIVGERQVLRFLATQLPALRRAGWEIILEGRVYPFFDSLEFATPVVQIQEPDGSDWFDVGFKFEDGIGASISQQEIQVALRKGECFIKRQNKTILIDQDAVDSLFDIFADCSTRDGAQSGQFRLPGIYAPFVKTSLDALDGIDVEDPAPWRTRADQQNRIARLEPVDLPGEFEHVLRPYQRDGVDWLRFLENNQFCGILADEMGLGKTVQTLAFLSLARSNPDARGLPALIVCPTSIVENWAEESARFAPDLRVLILTGTDRKSRWSSIPNHDLCITSYAIMRRDLETYLQHDFSVIVLDEAQHIKNRSTQNSVAAKQLRGFHRLVLTGTPVENSVSDLWSIMDFLMPTYLGTHDHFRLHYEQPIAHGGDDAERAQTKLRRKMNPFLLRRLKRDVAKDLPPKIERISFSHMTTDQQLVYREILKASRQKIHDLVAKKGFAGSRMQILATLMRLRQASCHLSLLKLPDLKAKQPSGKMDLFFELLNEAIDSGHRILVFSQFVSMLKILRKELEDRSLQYCYLDGSTKDRMKVVHTFNTEREIPLFLISLKAGGTGLNLTGADMVIHFDPWWNPAVEDQATDRAYRIGQHRTVYSIKLISRGTVEEKVLDLQKKKRAVIDATIARDDRQVMQNLTWDDVEELLTL